MRLFLYGTLLDPGMLARRSGDAALPARRVPATLTGFRRVTVRAGGRRLVAMAWVAPDALGRACNWEEPRRTP